MGKALATGVKDSALSTQHSGLPFDVLIVGGGIVGAGVARDAAMRGLCTALIEQYDFAAGTSSRTSRMLHGGLRYLAQGRLGLVRQASREKLVLHRIAPHLAEPLAFVFPTYRGGCWPRWQLSLGVKIYDWLCGHGNLGASRTLSRREVLALLPKLNPNGLTGGVRYFDGFTNDARLVLDTLRSAARHGACVRNYTRLEAAAPDGSLWRCRMRERESGAEFEIKSRCVVSAAGPWAGQLPQNKLALRLTKGVHLVISRERLPVPDAVVMAEGKRILFAIPWGERVILGTTDTDFTDPSLRVRSTHVGPLPQGEREFDPLANVQADDGDIAYILDVANRAFPEAGLNARDVLSAWAGLRPLLAAPRGGPSDISRSHEIRMSAPGWLEIAGGKLTTYRLMAQQAVDKIIAYLGLPRAACRTAREPLVEPGEAQYSGILPPPVSAAAVEYFCAHEWARYPEDILLRRTSWQHYCADPAAVKTQVTEWMKTERKK